MPAAGDGARPSARRYRIDLFDQCLFWGDEQLYPTNREFELLAFLAFCDRSVGKDELAEAFSPRSTSDAADGAIRVTVARIRKKYGPDIIENQRGSYVLSDQVENSLRAISARAARCQAQGGASLIEAGALRADARAIERYLAAPRPAYEWGADLDRALETLLASIREIEQRLGSEAGEDSPAMPGRHQGMRRHRLFAAGAVIVALLAVLVSAAAVRASWITIDRGNQIALARMLASEGFARAAKTCSATRDRCIAADASWLNSRIPEWSNITTPGVPSFYSVPQFRVSDCRIDFTKSYTALNSTAIIDTSRESGTLTQVQQVFYAERDYGGDDRFHSRWRTFPTVILESYRPFVRLHMHRSPDTYKYIFLLFDSKQNAIAVLRHLQLLSLLCGSGPWAPA